MQPILPRWMLITLSAMLLMFVVLIQVDRASAKDTRWRWKECRFQSLYKPIWTQGEELLTARCAVEKYIPGQLATFLRVGDCESGFSRFAYNPNGPYLGIFQHAASAYVSRIHTYEPDWDKPLSERWTNSRGQIVMTARMVEAVGWSPWSCA